MTRAWLVVVLVGLATVVIKSAGPVLLGGRPVPSRLLPVLSLVAPALFAALIVTQVFTHGQKLTFDARAAGLIVAVLGAARGVRPLVVLVLACAATAALRMVLQ